MATNVRFRRNKRAKFQICTSEAPLLSLNFISSRFVPRDSRVATGSQVTDILDYIIRLLGAFSNARKLKSESPRSKLAADNKTAAPINHRALTSGRLLAWPLHCIAFGARAPFSLLFMIKHYNARAAANFCLLFSSRRPATSFLARRATRRRRMFVRMPITSHPKSVGAH